MKKDNNQNIKCNVTSCCHNNQNDKKCDLSEIYVSCTCNKDDCTCSKETICESFKSRENE